MKYFTKEELDYIAKELMADPSKETLKRLNDKYNGDYTTSKNLDWVESPINNGPAAPQQNIVENTSQMLGLPEMNNESITNFSVPTNENSNQQVDISVKEEVPSIPKFDVESNLKTPVWNPTANTNNTLFDTNINTPNTNINMETQSSSPNYTSSETISMPNLNIQEAPQTNLSDFAMPKLEPSSITNGQVPFNGNLWETPNTSINNMMQTTDNFNTSIEQTNNNAVPMGEISFFQSKPAPVNNPIPISESPKVEGPTMFGQFEQNFNNNAA